MIPATTSVSTDALSSKLDELDTISFFVMCESNSFFPDRQTGEREREREKSNAYEFRVYSLHL